MDALNTSAIFEVHSFTCSRDNTGYSKNLASCGKNDMSQLTLSVIAALAEKCYLIVAIDILCRHSLCPCYQRLAAQ